MSNNKRDGVGLSFEESLTVQSLPFYSLKKCLLLEVFIGNKKICIITLQITNAIAGRVLSFVTFSRTTHA